MDLADFPPFYTLQPVLATREKQLALWRQVILASVPPSAATAVIDISLFAKFENAQISRKLDLESRRVVCESVISTGFGEWEDPTTRTLLRVYSKTPEAIAAAVYEFANQAGLVGQEISTFYELHSGESVEGTELFGINPDLLLKALKTLESKGKLFLYPGTTLDEMGVKFA
ncbi:hypothetical protein BASA81_016506 [Batrachochytrium salamandrivorans]|nr:hypothetical protein BASA81_016506 [Batrachochytrium salamandrivorans]